jgi:hypothetical protein|nr:MAG TPA: Baseplate wedge protein [Bacteriophage sp.]DAK44524.1 MAG TPA: Baseplate wedge protein [Herelleviridae sp.]DAM52837.1 MAG TPA: Baseplate wedge protein [Caudoviricetes sp.]DAM87474.1 MAG TPA: Baseplate wedge protein [Bacteriophage sp.]DAN33174.1 MAG TPA: Baseplate wedge protein [Caudoviricetes sp.]
MALDFLKYQKIAENGREFLRTDIWEFSFVDRPTGVYMPPDENLLIRCTDFNVSIDNSIDRMEAQIRGFTIYQPVTSNKADGSFSMRFIDREDMSIQYMFNDWADKIMEKETKKTGRKLDLTCTVMLKQYNTHRQVIKTLVFYNAFPTTASEMGESSFGQDATTNGGEYDIEFQFEYYERQRNSVPITDGTAS